MHTGWWNIPGWPFAEEWAAWWALLTLLATLIAASAAFLAVKVARDQLSELIRSNDSLTVANEEAARANLAVSRPYVTVDLQLHKHEFRDPNGPMKASLRIEITNHGRSPAKNVRLAVSPEWDSLKDTWVPGAYEDAMKRLNGLFAGKVTYSILQPGRSYSLLLDQGPGRVNDTTLDRRYTLTAKYTTIDGLHEFTDDYELDIDALGPTMVPTDPHRRISKDIQALTYLLKQRL